MDIPPYPLGRIERERAYPVFDASLRLGMNWHLIEFILA